MPRGWDHPRIVIEFIFFPYIDKKRSIRQSDQAGQLCDGDFGWRRHGVHLEHEDQDAIFWLSPHGVIAANPMGKRAYQDTGNVKTRLRSSGQLGDWCRFLLSLRVKQSNLGPVLRAPHDPDCRAASLLTLNPVRFRRHFHRHGRACPGHRWWHSAATMAGTSPAMTVCAGFIQGGSAGRPAWNSQ